MGANIYRRHTINRTTSDETLHEGWKTDEVTRKTIIDQMAKLIRDKAVDIPSLGLLDECRNFVRNNKGKPEAAAGKHDDRVLCAAIGLHLIGLATTKEIPTRQAYNMDAVFHDPKILMPDGFELSEHAAIKEERRRQEREEAAELAAEWD